MASPDGTTRILGNTFHDVDIAIAAKKVIVTCEELVSDEYIKNYDAADNKIPGFCVDAVVHAPFGAHPSQCYDYYDYDADFYKMYNVESKTEENFNAFLDEWVYGVKDHEEYLNKLGATRLIGLKNVPGFGYSTDALKKGEDK